MSRRSTPLLALALCSCEDGGTTHAPTPPLEPIDRRGIFALVAERPESLDRAVAAAPSYPSAIVVAAGPLSPGTGLDPDLSESTMQGLEDALAGGGPAFGFTMAALTEPAGDLLCFDPANPETDPTLLARKQWLETELARWSVSALTIDISSPTPLWSVPCQCPSCDTTDAAGQAERALTVWSLLGTTARSQLAEPWLVGNLAPGAPDDQAESFLDASVRAFGRTGAATILRPQLGPAAPWATEEPKLGEGDQRRQAGWLDLGPKEGPTDALIVRPDDIWDHVRTGAVRGLVGWWLNVDGPDGSAYDRLDGIEVDLASALLLDRSLDAASALRPLLAERFALAEDSPALDALVQAARASGRAWDLATHPGGLSIVHAEEGLPPAFPLDYLDPRPWDKLWSDRWLRLHAPDEQALMEFGQWGAEAMALSAEVRAAVAQASSSLDAAAAERLTAQALALDFGVRAWALTVRADLALRARVAVLPERIDPWLRDDASALELLATEAEAALASGAVTEVFPADPSRLRTLANLLRAAVGPGDALSRAFPVITQVDAAWVEGRAQFTWHISPSATASLRTGLAPPAVDDAGPAGEEAAANWTAYINELPLGVRIWWRPCGNADGYELCAAERVFHTPSVTAPVR